MKREIKKIYIAALSLLFVGTLTACGESHTPDSSSESVVLSSPQNVHLSLDWTGLKTDYILTWDNVENAEGYKITVGENFFETSEQSYNLSSVLTVGETYEIGIQTVGDGEKYGNSETVTIEEEIKSVSNKIIYEELEDGTYEIYKEKNDWINGELVLPDTYNGVNITQIAISGFEEPYQEISTLKPKFDFNIKGITSIRFPRYLISMEKRSFYSCMNLRSVEIPESVTNFGTAVFSECISLTNVIFSESMTKIPPSIFMNCWKLENVMIPTGVTEIGANAFSVTNLKNIEIPDSVTVIGDSVFDNTAVTQVKIPDCVEVIGNGVFNGCEKLREVEFGQGSQLKTIGDYAFSNTALTELVIPKSVTNVGYGICRHPYSSKGQSQLIKITVEEGNTTYKSVDGSLYTIDGNILLQYASGKSETEFVVPESVVTIRDGAFSGTNFLKKVTIPNVTLIEKMAFANCPSLEYIILPQNVICIESTAFMSCPSLKLLQLSPNSIIDLNGSAGQYIEFVEGWTEITTKLYKSNPIIIIPKSTEKIGNLTDYWGSTNASLTVYYKGTVEEWEAIECEDIGTTDVTIYYYSESEPPLNEDETAYDGNYWYYGDDGVPVIWVLIKE